MLALLVAALLRARLGAAPRLDRRLLLAAGADRLHPRRRRHPRHRPAREAARSLDRRTRAAAAALGGRPRARQRQRRDGRRSARSRSRSSLVLGRVMPRLPAALARRRRRDRALVGARPAGARRRGRRPDSRGAAELRPARAPPGRTSSSSCPAAVGIFLVSFADEILTARSFAGKHNQHVRASQELLAMGAANAAAGFTQGFSIGASGSRTAVNDSMGARSQIAGLVAAATRARDPALPHRAGAVPAEGRARRGDRLRGDRARRPAAPGARSPRSTTSRSRSPA